MFSIPEFSSPEFQAFVTGMFLPFFAAALGYAVSVVRHLLFSLKQGE